MRSGKTLVNNTTKSIVSYYLNPKVTIVSRVKAYAKRIRLRAKLFNQVRYSRGDASQERAVTTQRLENDVVDYIKVVTQLGQELLTKVTFLSNNDAICLLDILTRIRKPLKRLYQTQRIAVCKVKIDNSHTAIDKNHSGAKHGNADETPSPLYLLRNVQKKIIEHVLGDEQCSGISKRDRYYLICALSRDCSLVTVKQWKMLFEHVLHAFEASKTDIYAPFEIANLILVYNQISKWVAKREAKALHQKFHNDVMVPGEISNALQLSNAVELGGDFLNRDAVYNGLEKLVPNISRLTFDKIIKLLYLQCSINLFNVNFFVSTIDFLHIAKIIKYLDWNEMTTCIKLYNRAVWRHLVEELECLNIDLDRVELVGALHTGLLESSLNCKPSPKNCRTLNDQTQDLQQKALLVKVEKLCLGLIYLLVAYTRRYLGCNEKALDAEGISLLLQNYESNTPSSLISQIKELAAIMCTTDPLRNNASVSSVAVAERHLLDIVTILSTTIVWNTRLCKILKPEKKLYNPIYERSTFLIEMAKALLGPLLRTGGNVFSNEDRLVRVCRLLQREVDSLADKDTTYHTNNPSDEQKTHHASMKVAREILADVTVLLKKAVRISR